MSHKTIYIDIDEEITSIIDRVRRTQSLEVIVVAPKRALLLQSLVNLKLLKKEADRRRKKIMIVTQDKIGKKLIEKAGILVQQKMDDSMEQEIELEEKAPVKETKAGREIMESLKNEKEDFDFGSDSYFDKIEEEKMSPEAAEAVQETEKTENVGKVVFSEPRGKNFTDMKSVPAKSKAKSPAKKTRGRKKMDVQMSDIVAGPGKGMKKNEENISQDSKEDLIEVPASLKPANFQKQKKSRQRIEKQAEKFFSASPSFSPITARREEKHLKTTRVKGKSKHYFIIFAVIFLALSITSGIYFYLPKASLTLYLKNQEKSVSASLEANTAANAVDDDKSVIPAVLEQITKEKTEEFSASGQKSGDSGKATGKVVIYNEFSADNQSLVTTTRLETADGKIFRLTNGVVVPGMTKVGTDVQPGAIEADVIADKPGTDYNIDPTTFKITGFKGSPKFDKFYAKSTKAMGSGAENGTTIVSSQDITSAKETLAASAKKDAVEELKNGLPAGRKVFDDAIVAELVSAKPSENVGAQTDKFSVTVEIKAKTLSFSENDMKTVVGKSAGIDTSSLEPISFSNQPNYLLTESNLEQGFVKFEVKGDLGVADNINIANFKKGILGKNSDELSAFVKTYPSIQKAEVNFSPFFVTRVPMNEKRVSVEVK